MLDPHACLVSFAAVLALALAAWVVSYFKGDVSIVDSLWSVLIALAALVFAAAAARVGVRAGWLFALLGAWALRLCAYITWRNWGEPEDRRYAAIRQRNQPHFAFKSVYLVFGLQGVLGWIVALPLMAALAGDRPVGWLDAAAAALMLFGLVFESVGDAQLVRFKGAAANGGKVMDRGLWRYTRHPNYFGEFCVWWGFYLVALSAGGWWTLISPLLVSFTLLKVSGVALLEKDIAERRPDYRDYILRTNAFFPGPPHAAAGAPKG
jgi:steroid 5-alpha reductase family enzyme